MKNRKNIIIILSIVLVMALLIEIARTEYLFKIGSNDNDHHYTIKSQKTNSLSDDEASKVPIEKYLVIYDMNDNASIRLKSNITQVLSYMKKHVKISNINDYKGIDDEYKAIIIAVEKLNSFSGMNDIIDYVFNGGKAFFAIRPAADGVFYNLYQKLGINEAGQWTGDAGIKLTSNVLIKGKSYKVDQDFFYNDMISVQLKKECTKYAESLNGIPMLWDAHYGSGKFMVFNGTILWMKINRGLITGALSLLDKDYIYPVMNMKLAFLDDFPAPIPQGSLDNISRDYGRNLPNFYREIWWADILRGAKNYDLKYSSVIIETYNDRVEPPFEDREGIDINSLIVYGREVIKSGGELGIHGYNHQPLALDGFIKEDMGYTPWRSEQDMIASLQEVNNFIRKVYPRYTLRSYVPPSNILSPEGRQAIVKALPDMKIIASSYMNNDTEYVQEYQVSSDGIIELPRMSAGYSDTEVNNWSILNGVTSLAVFSHFIHPDDLLDPQRSQGKSWKTMSREYDELLKRVYNNFKWLRSMTVSKGGAELENYIDTEVYTQYKEDSINIYCNNFAGEIYFILRSDKKAEGSRDCEIHKIDEGVYLVNAKKPHVIINLSR